MQGIGPLQTPRDLLAKLLHDLERMRADPTDIYAAFDFFFTAHHMLDWVAPTPDARKDPVGYQAAIAKHQAIEAKEKRLLIAGHLANNAKHFEAHRWDEVSATCAAGGDKRNRPVLAALPRAWRGAMIRSRCQAGRVSSAAKQ